MTDDETPNGVPETEAGMAEAAAPSDAAPSVASERPTIPEGMESTLPDDVPRIMLPLFEGPLDLLLYLIRREKIDIHDIPDRKSVV